MLLSYMNCIHLYQCDNEALKIKLLHLDMIIFLREKKLIHITKSKQKCFEQCFGHMTQDAKKKVNNKKKTTHQSRFPMLTVPVVEC